MPIMTPEETARRYQLNRAKNKPFNPDDLASGVDQSSVPLPMSGMAENLRPDQSLEELQAINLRARAQGAQQRMGIGSGAATAVGASPAMTAGNLPALVKGAKLGAFDEDAARARAESLSNATFLRQAQDQAHKEFVNPAFYGTTAAAARAKMNDISQQLAKLNLQSGERGIPLEGADKARFMNAGREATALLNPTDQTAPTPVADLYAHAKDVQAQFAAKAQQRALGIGPETMAQYEGLATPPANLDPAARNEQVLSEQKAKHLAYLQQIEKFGGAMTPEEQAQIPVPNQGPSPQDRAAGIDAFTGEMADIQNRRAVTPEMVRDRAVSARAHELLGTGEADQANARVSTMRQNQAELIAANHRLALLQREGQARQALNVGGKSPDVVAAEDAAAKARALADAAAAGAELGGVDVIAEHARAVNAMGGEGSGDLKIKDAITDLNDEGGFLLRGTLNSLTGLRGTMDEIRSLKDPRDRRAIANAILRGVNPEAKQRIMGYGDDNEGKNIYRELLSYKNGK